jgi:hypothetical protein
MMTDERGEIERLTAETQGLSEDGGLLLLSNASAIHGTQASTPPASASGS